MSTSLSSIVQLAKDRIRDQNGQSIDFTQNGFRAINSTLQIWNEVHDWPWTIKNVNFNYNQGVDTYPIDGLFSDFKYPLTLKYYKPYGKYLEFWMTSPLRFDSAYIYSDRFAVQNLAGVQTMRIKSSNGLSAGIQSASSYNGDGLWIGDGVTITNVGTDNYEGWRLPSSVSCNFNGTSGTLTNSTFKAIDLSIFQNRGNIYFDVYLSSVTNVTSFTLKWGSSSSNYFSASATTDYVGAAFIVGWNRIKINWTQAPTQVGTPVITAIDYLQMTLACSGPTNLGQVLVQNFIVCENIPLTLTYYSTNMVQTTALVQSQVFTNSASTTDLFLWSGRWDVASEPFIDSLLQILFWMTGEYADFQIAMSKIQDIILPLKQRYPSQRRYPTMQFVPDINYQSGGPSNATWDNGGSDPDF